MKQLKTVYTHSFQGTDNHLVPISYISVNAVTMMGITPICITAVQVWHGT